MGFPLNFLLEGTSNYRLDGRFRHSIKRFEDCFEAVCVICQYQIENGYDLYDILIEDMLYHIV